MKGYWLRILGAWLLLRAAGSLMEDAQKLLANSAQRDAITVEAVVVE